MKELWTEKYRPRTIDEYVFVDANQRAEVESWIKDDSIPHLLFSGGAGTGIGTGEGSGSGAGAGGGEATGPVT